MIAWGVMWKWKSFEHFYVNVPNVQQTAETDGYLILHKILLEESLGAELQFSDNRVLALFFSKLFVCRTRG